MVHQFLAHNKNNGFSNYYYIFFFKLIPSLKVGLGKIYAFVTAV